VIDVEGVPEEQVVGLLLRKALPQRPEALAAVPGAVHHDATVYRDPPLVALRQDEPGEARVSRMHGNGEAEC
jgi:hypothetical protein